MARRGGGRRTYVRDANGRFASTPGGGGGSKRPKARMAQRGPNRLTRDNAGKITSQGGNGATVRGGRLRTAGGNLRATQLASMKAAGFRGSTIAKGGRGIRGSVARSLAAVRKERMAAARPAAAKQQPQRTSKKPTNKAQRAYLAARSKARAFGGDLRGSDAVSRRMANSAAAVVRGMERRRSATVPKAPADSPRARQQQRQVARVQRAIRNERAGWAREADGPNSKASRSVTVARRAQQIYAGKVDPKAKTKSRLTKTRDPEALRKRIAKVKDNTAIDAAKAAVAKTAKATKAKPKATTAKGGKGEGRAIAGQKKALAGGTESNKKSKALAKPQPQNKGPKGKKRWLSNDQVIQANEARGNGVRNTAEVMRSRLPKKTATALGVNTLGGYIAKINRKPLSFDAANRVTEQIEKITGVGRSQLQGVRTTIDNARKTVTYDLGPVARKQAAIAEKAGSRKPRRRKP